MYKFKLVLELSLKRGAMGILVEDERLLKQKENGYELYWMGMGVDDMDMLLKGNEAFRSKMDSLDMTCTYKETAGGHTWNN